MKKGIQLSPAENKRWGKRELERTLESFAAMGYQGVEMGHYFDLPAKELRSLLADKGLKGINTMVPLARLKEDLPKEIAYAKQAGIQAITIPSIAGEARSPREYQEFIAHVPVYLQACRKAGLSLCYHNTDVEYESVGNYYILDMIMSASPSLLLELDTYWTSFMGVDVVYMMKRYANRLKYLHITDYAETGRENGKLGQTPPIGNEAVLSRARELGVQWVVVKQDNSRVDVVESARLSVQSLRSMGL